jgi:hypothetical protein
MPTCNSCKTWKPSKDFRLVKINYLDKARLSDVCYKCEKGNFIKCAKCGNKREKEYKDLSQQVFWCKVCKDHLFVLQLQITSMRVEFKIKSIINKLNKMGNTINNLRDTLFSTIEGLKDGTIDIDVAKQITITAQTIIDSCRVENEFMEIAGGKGSGFIPLTIPLNNDSKLLNQGE